MRLSALIARALQVISKRGASYKRVGSVLIARTHPSTDDTDVIGYSWLFVDLDPKRKSGISSSDEELNKAFRLAQKIYQFLLMI